MAHKKAAPTQRQYIKLSDIVLSRHTFPVLILFSESLNEGLEISMNSHSMEETLMSSNEQFREGQMVMYEGKRAEVIGVKPLLIIKVKDRVVCGALHAWIELIKERSTHFQES